MKHAFIQILCILALCLSSGCQQPEPKRKQASIEGVKLSDLVPAKNEFNFKQIQLDFVAFEMPAENFSTVSSVIETLSDADIVYTSKKNFKTNGFTAGIGLNEQWKDFIPALRQARARKAFTSKLLVFDQQGDDVHVKNIRTPIDISYISRIGDTREITLPDGRPQFRIKATPLSQRKGLAAIRLEALYRNNFGGNLPAPKGITVTNETLFDFSSIKLKLNEGDFLIIAPDAYSDDYTTVSSLFFSFIGNYPEPVTDEEDLKKGINFRIKPDTPLLRIYMLICVKVDSQ